MKSYLIKDRLKKILSDYENESFSKGIIAKFFAFAGVGVFGTAAHYLTLITLVQLLRINPVISSGIGFVNGALVNYYLNYHITFRSNKKHHEAVVKFFVVAVIGLILNTAIISIAINRLNLHYLLSQIVATGIVLFWNFMGNIVWTFKEGKDGHE